MAQAVVPGAAEPEFQLDRAAFTEVVHLKALRVPTARCQELMKKFSGCGFAGRSLCCRNCAATGSGGPDRLRSRSP